VRPLLSQLILDVHKKNTDSRAFYMHNGFTEWGASRSMLRLRRRIR
jgi:RimJ/RimL family protein N-acetyltransferase